MTKSIGEMTGPELRAFCEQESGIRMPEPGASARRRAEWMVAYYLALVLRNGGSAEEAEEFAIAELATSNDGRYVPYLEQAIGRALTSAELISKKVRKAAAAELALLLS